MAVGAKEGLELHARGRGAEARELFAAMGDRAGLAEVKELSPGSRGQG